MEAREIARGKTIDSAMALRILDAIGEYAGDNEELLLGVADIVNGGHMCEFSAWHRIRRMEAVAYIGKEGKRIEASSMEDYLSEMGVTADSSHRLVLSAYERAKASARELGFTAPDLDANRYDCLWAVAMVLSDYWHTVCGDLEKAAMIAYEYLSDPDR